MDIRSNHGYPSSALSNFAARSFTVDGVQCRSMEGFLQSLKFKRPATQRRVCLLEGAEAKARGSRASWTPTQTLWWNGVVLDRHGPEYQQLLDRAYRAMYDQCLDFREALRASGRVRLTHTSGRSDPSQTILTEVELCSRLEVLRECTLAPALQPRRNDRRRQLNSAPTRP